MLSLVHKKSTVLVLVIPGKQHSRYCLTLHRTPMFPPMFSRQPFVARLEATYDIVHNTTTDDSLLFNLPQDWYSSQDALEFKGYRNP